MHKLYFSQKLPVDWDQAWDFFSSPANLEKITPPTLALKITDHHENKPMYAGQILTYTVSPLWNINLEWVTEITAVEKPHYFIDEQRFGPYVFWHHEHRFTPIHEGTLIEDLIYYKLPLGIIGRALNHLKVKKDLDQIFSYRSQVLSKMFQTEGKK